MTTSGNLPKVDLFCTTGGSNKEYHLFTEAHDDGTYTLMYANGSIGSAMKPKVKTGPTTLAAVQKEFDKTVKSKTTASPPYTESKSGVDLVTTKDAGDPSGWTPHLLTEAPEETWGAYMRDDNWLAMEKMMGERRAILIMEGEVRGANKKGRFIGGLPATWTTALGKLPVGTVIDGEHIGNTLHIFDAPRWGGRDVSHEPFESRLARVKAAVEALGAPGLVVLEAADGEAAKLEMLARVKGAIGEGLVFVRRDSAYTEGRAVGLRDSVRVKAKLYEASNCVVLRKNTGRSVALGMYTSLGDMLEVGSCTIPENQPIPAPNDVLRVRYMHMHDGGSLYGPPVSLGVQPGVKPVDCTLSQVTRIIARPTAPMDADDYEGEEPEVAAQRSLGVSTICAPSDDFEVVERERQRG